MATRNQIWINCVTTRNQISINCVTIRNQMSINCVTTRNHTSMNCVTTRNQMSINCVTTCNQISINCMTTHNQVSINCVTTRNQISINEPDWILTEIANLTSHYGLKQIINQPAHILNNASSCIDLLFTSQPNFVMESGVHSSLHWNFCHQITYARFNLKIYYPFPYEREIWHYKNANIDLIQQAIRDFNWERAFHTKNINEKVPILNNTINNVLSNFIPQENITCAYKKLPWFNKNIINLIKNKNFFYKSRTANENSTDKKEAIKALQNKLTFFSTHSLIIVHLLGCAIVARITTKSIDFMKDV